MYFKLSLRNVRKSFSDYTLYFLTLSFGVCMFYAFNSIEAQEAMMQISTSMAEIMKSITKMMNGVSVFVSFILGFLIVYANSFLIRRRKREFGLYMTLGMRKQAISRILISETLIVGAFSLAAGLLAGVFVAQGLSVITAKLFEVNMTGYTFVFSLQACWKTIIYFGLIFMIAVAAGTLSISKCTLIDLINASKHNEVPSVKKPALTLTLFFLSVLFLGVAYAMVLKFGIATFDRKLLIECILGCIGTFLFFASLSGALLSLVQKNKGFYYKGLNLFIMRQINSRINTTYLSMSFICLMLFVTIGIFSTGMGITSVLNKSFTNVTPFDMTLSTAETVDLKTALAQNGLELADYANTSYAYSLYWDQAKSLTLGTVFQEVAALLPAENMPALKKNLFPQPLELMALSDYNALMQLQSEPQLTLGDRQGALLTQYAWMDAAFQGCLEEYTRIPRSLTLDGNVYTVQPTLLTTGILNDNSSLMTLVVPDAALSGNPVAQSALCFNCKGDAILVQDLFTSRLENLESGSSLPHDLAVSSRNELQAQKGGSKAIVAFFGIYVGIVFLITSAAVLALQQLSEAADNRQRYEILKKIGGDDALINRTLFKQIALYFMLPLSLACVHSVVGIKVANDVVRQVGSLNAVRNILLTALLILLVYGAYFLATYLGSKRIMLKNGQRNG